jgi:hypothetical protein
MSRDKGIQVMVGKTITSIAGDHISIGFNLSDGSTVEITTSGQDRLEVKRTHEVVEKKKVKVTKDLV